MPDPLPYVLRGLKAVAAGPLGDLAVARGLIQPAQLQEALDDERVAEGQVALGAVLVERRWIAPSALNDLVLEMRRRELLAFLRDRAGKLPPEVERAELDARRDLGRYVLVEAVGRGGAAEVWKGWDRQLSRWVAVKLLRVSVTDVAVVRRFQREAVLAGHLRHPNIVAVHDAGVWDDRPYIVMDFIASGDLASWKARTRRDAGVIAAVVEKLARAIHAAHARGIVHRDLKPSNVLIDADGEPLIADFGLALSGHPTERITAAGAILGTPYYMAPEQVSCDPAGVDARCDVYALGVLLYELLTGDVPFRAPTIPELFRKIESGPAPRAPRALEPDVPRDLETVCLRAMARERQGRYATALEMAEDVARFRAGQPVRARRPSLTARGAWWLRQHKAPAALAAALIFGAAVVTALVVRDAASKRRVAALRESALAAASYREGDTAGAAAAARRAIALDVRVAEGHFWLGGALLRDYLGRRGLPSPWRIIGAVEFNPLPAESPAERALRDEIRERLARRFDDAEGWVQPCAEGLLAFVHHDHARADEMLSAARRHPSRPPDRDVDYVHALSLYFRKRFGAALELLDAMPVPRPPHVEIARARAASGLAIDLEFRKGDLEAFERMRQSCSEVARYGDAESAAVLDALLRTWRVGLLYEGGVLDGFAELAAAIGKLESVPPRTAAGWLALAQARYVRGRITAREGPWDRGVEMLGAAFESLDRSESLDATPGAAVLRAFILGERGLLHAMRGDMVRARADAQASVDVLRGRREDLPDIAVSRARALSLLDRVPEALDLLESAARRWPELPRVHLERAEIILSRASVERMRGKDTRSSLRQATESCDRVMAMAPDQMTAVKLRAACELAIAAAELGEGVDPSARLRDVEEWCARLERILPESMALRHMRASAQATRAKGVVQAGRDGGTDVAKAIAMMEECRIGRAGNLDLLLELAGLHQMSAVGGDAEAVERMRRTLEEARNLAPSDRRVRLMEASRAQFTPTREAIEAAIRVCTEVLEDDPEEWQASQMRAVLAVNLVVDRMSEPPEPLLELLEGALTDAQRALRVRPDDAVAWLARARALDARSMLRPSSAATDQAAAQEAYDVAVRARPADAHARGGRALFLHRLARAQVANDPHAARGIFARSEEDLTAALAAAPRDVKLRLLRAMVRLTLGVLAARSTPAEDVPRLATGCLEDTDALIAQGMTAADVYRFRGTARFLRAEHTRAARAEYELARAELKQALERETIPDNVQELRAVLAQVEARLEKP